MIAGNSGILSYGEIKPLEHLYVGYQVTEGEKIATVIPVLKKDKGWGCSMLHFEQYIHGCTKYSTWLLDTPKPKELLNPRTLLESL